MVSNSNLKYSNLGIGTYLGDINEKIDKKIYKVLISSIENGINLIDTAPNYRCERSEKIVGRLVKNVKRDKLVICTKVGFLPYSDVIPTNEKLFFTNKFIKSKIINPKDIYGDWQSFHPNYIEWQINESLKRLNTDYIDIYYLHNPEEILSYVNKDVFYDIISKAFHFLDKMINDGKVRFIGISSWNGFLDTNKIDLNQIMSIAKSSLKTEKFKFLQVPYNLAMADHLTQKTQINPLKNSKCSLMYLAAFYKIDVITNAPLAHGRLLDIEYPRELKEIVGGLKSNVELALKFSISNPTSNASLIGVTNQKHLDEIIEVMKGDLIPKETYLKILS